MFLQEGRVRVSPGLCHRAAGFGQGPSGNSHCVSLALGSWMFSLQSIYLVPGSSASSLILNFPTWPSCSSKPCNRIVLGVSFPGPSSRWHCVLVILLLFLLIWLPWLGPSKGFCKPCALSQGKSCYSKDPVKLEYSTARSEENFRKYSEFPSLPSVETSFPPAAPPSLINEMPWLTQNHIPVTSPSPRGEGTHTCGHAYLEFTPSKEFLRNLTIW